MKQLFFIAAIMLTLGLGFVACSNNNDKPKSEQLGKDEMYSCTMHNEVMSYHNGECPKCGMKLIKQKMTAEQEKMMKKELMLSLKNNIQRTAAI